MRKPWIVETRVLVGRRRHGWERHPRRYWTSWGAAASARASLFYAGADAVVEYRVLLVRGE